MCLDCLTPERQGLTNDAYQCIVTDDSIDQSARGVIQERYPWALWTAGPQRGPAANRNHGARLATASWVAFTDDDCLPCENWLRQILGAIQQHPETEVIEGRTRADREPGSLAETSPCNEAGGNFWSCNLSIRRNQFLEMGGFDENFPFPAMEDVDFAVRMKRANLKTLFLPSALIIHPWRGKNPVLEGLRYQKSVSYFKQKHPELRGQFSVAQILIVEARMLVKQTVPGLIKHRGKGFCVAVVEHLMGLLHAVKTLCSRYTR
jgi:GT2 family glycosyltransferase